MRRFDFRTLRVGETISGVACIVELDRRTTRKGKPFIAAVLRNSRGQATAKIWSERVPEWEGIEPGDPVDIQAKVVDGWQGNGPELVVESVRRLSDDDPIALEINPISSVPIDALELEFDAVVSTIERPELRMLLDVILGYKRDGVPLRRQYMTVPAAKLMHHNHLHGLLEHSLEVAHTAVRLGSVRPYDRHVDFDLLLVGGLVHDLGKIDEYSFGPRTPIGVGHLGRLRSHLSRGPELVALAVQDSGMLEDGRILESDVLAIQHIMESHHGEYGSAVQPRCLEAVMVHLADLASSRLRPMLDAIQREPMDAEQWVHPSGWKRNPVWHYRNAADAELFRWHKSRSAAPEDSGKQGLESSTGGTTAAVFIPRIGGNDE